MWVTVRQIKNYFVPLMDVTKLEPKQNLSHVQIAKYVPKNYMDVPSIFTFYQTVNILARASILEENRPKIFKNFI